jgi:hypothetical protein
VVQDQDNRQEKEEDERIEEHGKSGEDCRPRPTVAERIGIES